MTWLPLLLAETPDPVAISAAWPAVPAMAACPQDPVYHAEGDVWTHTRMVLDELLADPAYRAFDPETRQVLRLAAWFHDVAKPATTVEEWDGTENRMRIRQPGHARLGARMAWAALWRAGLPRPLREQVQWLIAWHQKPFHLWTATDMRREAITFAAVGQWRALLTLVRADNRGRIAPNAAETTEKLDLLELWLEEQDLLDRPFPFANDESRVRFFATPGRAPDYAAPAPRGSRVIVLSGLPGAGKDTHAAAVLKDLPQVSLDRLRGELGVDPEDPQGRVVQAVHEAARVHLRRREPFVWNATNLTRQLRAKVLGLMLDYEADITIHAFDRPEAKILAQNRARAAIVPDAVIRRLADKWEPPSPIEAHRVEWV